MGCGLLLRGRRDFDEETQSYIETHCLCILGIPILAYGAYRIVDAPDGGYILGREPLSILARALSAFVLLAGLGAGGICGWEAYTGSPAYIARQNLMQADALAAAGKVAESARLYRDVASADRVPRTRPPRRSGASRRCRGLPRRGNPRPNKRASSRWLSRSNVPAVGRSLPKISSTKEWRVQSQRGGADPAGALAILEAIAPLAPQADDLNSGPPRPARGARAAHPGDPELSSRLAAVYEAQGQEERAVALLEPIRRPLGTTEGARILGLADAHHDRVEPAQWPCFAPTPRPGSIRFTPPKPP